MKYKIIKKTSRIIYSEYQPYTHTSWVIKQKKWFGWIPLEYSYYNYDEPLDFETKGEAITYLNILKELKNEIN